MNQNTRIFSTDEGAVILKSDTKNEIVELFLEGDKSSKEIRDKLDKAKSTISVHLSDLVSMGIIKEKDHPKDRRKKIYSLNSKLLGGSEIPFDEHYEEILKNLRTSSGDSYELLKSLFHLIRYGLISFGLDVHPALKEIGRDAGRSIGKDFESDDMDGVLKEIDDFWSENQLGKVSITEDDTITVEDCFDCCDMPEVGETFCSLDEGMIEGVIGERLGKIVTVKEEECFGTGKEHCKFKITEDDQ